MKYLDKEHYLFGNKGAVWSKEVHIAVSDFSGTTLCGTPMLSSNHAAFEKVETPGCLDCIEKFMDKKLKEWYQAGKKHYAEEGKHREGSFKEFLMESKEIPDEEADRLIKIYTTVTE